MPRPAARLAVLALLGPALAASAAAPADAAPARVPVVLDTDIGDDIDDTWALLMLLRSPQLDVKLITTTYGKREYRAKLICKFLELAKRTEIPVGMGAGGAEGVAGQADWVKDYDLATYPGTLHANGVQALVDAVMKAPRPLSIIGIGPNTTVAAALAKEPAVAGKAVFIGMQGSVRVGYHGAKAPCPEWNVKAAIPASQAVLHAPWKGAVITPLDTCGLVQLRGERFAALRDSPDPLVRALMENYRMWAKKGSVGELKESSILFDTVAVYLAYPGEKPLATMETLRIRVDDKGMTRVDPAGAAMSVAAAWTDRDGYDALLVKTLLGK